MLWVVFSVSWWFPLKHESFYFLWSPVSSFLLLFVLLALSKKLWPDVDFPHSSVGKESTCSAGDSGPIPGLGRSAGEGIGYPLQYSWASLVAQLVKNMPAMWETWVQSLGWEDPLEKGKATHSSIQAWRIPWTVWSMSLTWLSDQKKKKMTWCKFTKTYTYIFPTSLTVSALKLRYLVHFELIWDEGPTLFLCIWISSCPNTMYRKGFFPYWIVLAFLLKANWFRGEHLFLDSDIWDCPYASTRLSWLPYLCSEYLSWGVWILHLYSFWRLLWLLWPTEFPYA